MLTQLLGQRVTLDLRRALFEKLQEVDLAYIERNPVAAGLCASPEDWPWSSARWRPAWKLGVAFRLEFLPADDQQRLLAAWQSK